MEIRQVLTVWRSRKLDHNQAIKDVIRTRARGAAACVDHIRYIENAEREEETKQEETKVKELLRQHMKKFIVHPTVTKWIESYTQEFYGKSFRFKTLLLRGWSRAGKTMFAKHLFGEENTIVVNCQGLEENLPSLRHFVRGRHCAIVFDEANVRQVLKNKALFQAGADRVELAQSTCGGFRYSIWPYQVAMICCSNEFPTTIKEGLKNEEEYDWIKSNVECIQLPKHQGWFIPDTPEAQWSNSAGA